MGRRSTSAYETRSSTPRLHPKPMAALLRWLGLDGRGREAAARRLLLLWRRMRRRAAPWSDLPPELLGLVFSRLPSQADRVRLRAFCRTWCSAARLQPLPPPLPLLLLRDNTLLALPDGTLHRLPLDWDGTLGTRMSTGGTLFLQDSLRGCYFVDPFSRSGETTPQTIDIYNPYQPCLCHRWIRKVVVSQDIVAVLHEDPLHEGKVRFFPRGDERSCSTMVWAPPVSTHVAVDIALFQGKHYILVKKYFDGASELPELHLLDIINHSVRSVQCIQGMPRNYPGLPASTGRSCFYLVVSGDMLLMVELQIDVEVRPYSEGSSSHIRKQFEFEVSEWVDQIGCHGRWSKVDTLMARTLFISPDYSRSLPAQSGAREDCIYYVTESESKVQDDNNLDCIVYNVKDKIMEPLASEMEAAMKVRNRGRWHPTRLFPADV